MKTITLEVSDEVADKLLAMDNNKRTLILELITNIEKKANWKDLFIKTSDQAEKQGLTDEKLDELLSDE